MYEFKLLFNKINVNIFVDTKITYLSSYPYAW
jgi:hypothetical protein